MWRSHFRLKRAICGLDSRESSTVALAVSSLDATASGPNTQCHTASSRARPGLFDAGPQEAVSN